MGVAEISTTIIHLLVRHSPDVIPRSKTSWQLSFSPRCIHSKSTPLSLNELERVCLSLSRFPSLSPLLKHILSVFLSLLAQGTDPFMNGKY